MSVPANHQHLVDRLRSFIKDEADINTLLEAQENTDDFLYMCITDAVDEINWLYMPPSSYILDDVATSVGGNVSGVPWVLVRMGAVLQYLTGAGIHSSRNTFTYSDGSGIQVNDTDTWGRYINYYNVLITKYRELLSRFKMDKNINDCYGGHYSQYNDIH